MNAKPNKLAVGFFSRRTLTLALISIGTIVGISYATINTRFKDDPLRTQPIAEVKQGPLTISITYVGAIQARDKEVIKSELEGQSAILYIATEGSQVKKGDLLVELDASTLKDQLVDQQIKVQNADAAWINAQENLAIVKSKAESDIDKANLTYDFAKQDYKKYLDGEYPKAEKDALSLIKQREEELSLATDKVKWSVILNKEKYLSQSELDGDKLAETRSTISLDSAKNALELLQKYTYKRQIAQLVSDVTQAFMAYDRTVRQASANIVQAQADFQAKNSEFERQKGKQKKIEDQIKKAKQYAEMDSVVVYVSQSRGFRGNEEPLREGTMVRERQEMIYLPTTSSYKADTKIHESNLDKIRLGLPVRITIDALNRKEFTGQIATIAPLPDAQSMFMNPDLKLYNTEIYIDGDGDGLRSGMTCESEIIIDQFKDTMYIPVQSVIRIGGQPTVYLVNGIQAEPHAVELGLDNNRLCQIKSGLKKGEKVLLNPPLASAEVKDASYQEFNIPKRVSVSGASSEMRRPGSDADAITRPANNGQNPAGPGSRGMRGGDGSRRGGGQDFQNMTPEQREQMRQRSQSGGPGGENPGGGRPDFQNMTQEQRDQMRQRFQNMTPEEREQMRQRFQQGGPGGANPGGGQPDTQNMTQEQRDQMRQKSQQNQPRNDNPEQNDRANK